MSVLQTLKGQALKAAMQGGVAGWGEFGLSSEHIRFAVAVKNSSCGRCSCGCESRATHHGAANGIVLVTGCQLSIQRWIKTGRLKS